jgi:hypothetical protein
MAATDLFVALTETGVPIPQPRDHTTQYRRITVCDAGDLRGRCW